MKDLIEYIIKSIVQKPKKVQVEEIPGEGFISIAINADDKDLGQIIGKKGKIIKALQSLAEVRGLKENKRCFLKIGSALEKERVSSTTIA